MHAQTVYRCSSKTLAAFVATTLIKKSGKQLSGKLRDVNWSRVIHCNACKAPVSCFWEPSGLHSLLEQLQAEVYW